MAEIYGLRAQGSPVTVILLAGKPISDEPLQRDAQIEQRAVFESQRRPCPRKTARP